MISPATIEVTEDNVATAGFFCAMSKPETRGYQDKLAWLKQRFREGLKIHAIAGAGRGFIEYMPGESAWRGVEAPRWMVIHCLWVVGRSKGRGYGRALLDRCLADARKQKLRGVAAVAARGRIGLTDTGFFLHHGFRVVDTAPPGLDLVALRFGHGPDPKFLGGWQEKAAQAGEGLTIFTSPQCPYTWEGAEKVVALSRGIGIPARTVHFEELAGLRAHAPSPYGSFDVACGGRVLAHTACLSAKKLRQLTAGDPAR